jgi:type I restriction enzyme S subunit
MKIKNFEISNLNDTWQNKLYDAKFISYWLRKNKQNIVATYLQGGQGNLSGSIVKELQFDRSTYNEQIKVGTIFDSLDNLITLHQCK